MAPDSPQACIAPSTFVELTGQVAGTSRDAAGRTVAALGSYERISPDGRFVLRSYSGAQVGQCEPDGTAGVCRHGGAGLSHAVVQRGVSGAGQAWRYLVDMTGEHYRLADILQFARQGTPAVPGWHDGLLCGGGRAAGQPSGRDPHPLLHVAQCGRR